MPRRSRLILKSAIWQLVQPARSKLLRPAQGLLGLLVGPGLEIVRQVELQVIHDAGGNFVDDAVRNIVRGRYASDRRLDSVEGAVQYHAGRCHDPTPAVSRYEVRVHSFRTHLVLEGSADKFADGDGPPCAKNDRTRRSGSRNPANTTV